MKDYALAYLCLHSNCSLSTLGELHHSGLMTTTYQGQEVRRSGRTVRTSPYRPERVLTQERVQYTLSE